MENLEKIDKYRAIIKQILSQYSSYKPSYGDIEIQTLFDTEQDHYQVLGVGWNKKERIYGCSMHLDIKPTFSRLQLVYNIFYLSTVKQQAK